MANFALYTPCSDRRYERCANYIVNDFGNEKCLKCIRNHEYQKAKAVINPDVVKDNFKNGEPQYKIPF